MSSMRKNVICSRETSWLISMVSAVMIAADPSVNSPTPSEVLKFALDSLNKAEAQCGTQDRDLDYEAIMDYDIRDIAELCSLPRVSPNALQGRYTFSVSGDDVVRALLRKCGEMTMRFAPVEVRPAYCIRLCLRVGLMMGCKASIPFVEQADADADENPLVLDESDEGE